MRDQEAIARAEQLDGRNCLVSNDHHVNEPAVRPTQRVSGATTVGGTASSERFAPAAFAHMILSSVMLRLSGVSKTRASSVRDRTPSFTYT
jgi:hypothetical protein